MIVEDGLELFEIMNFDLEDDRKKFDVVLMKFEDLCIGEINEIYERIYLIIEIKKVKVLINMWMFYVYWCNCLIYVCVYMIYWYLIVLYLILVECERSCYKGKSLYLVEWLIFVKVVKLYFSRW